jgi:hypothetical protein
MRAEILGKRGFWIDDTGGQALRGNALKFTVERVTLEPMVEQLKFDRGMTGSRQRIGVASNWWTVLGCRPQERLM